MAVGWMLRPPPTLPHKTQHECHDTSDSRLSPLEHMIIVADIVESVGGWSEDEKDR